MDSRIGPELIALGILLLCSAILSGAEAAYFSLGRTRLRELAEQQGAVPQVVVGIDDRQVGVEDGFGHSILLRD